MVEDEISNGDVIVVDGTWWSTSAGTEARGAIVGGGSTAVRAIISVGNDSFFSVR
jgi:hypothetical protein